MESSTGLCLPLDVITLMLTVLAVLALMPVEEQGLPTHFNYLRVKSFAFW
jgi:hypothetical protein